MLGDAERPRQAFHLVPSACSEMAGMSLQNWRIDHMMIGFIQQKVFTDNFFPCKHGIIPKIGGCRCLTHPHKRYPTRTPSFICGSQSLGFPRTGSKSSSNPLCLLAELHLKSIEIPMFLGVPWLNPSCSSMLAPQQLFLGHQSIDSGTILSLPVRFSKNREFMGDPSVKIGSL